MSGTCSAFIVASDTHRDPSPKRLLAPFSDARALTDMLKDPGISGFEVRILNNKSAHLINLAVEDSFADRRPNDLLHAGELLVRRGQQ